MKNALISLRRCTVSLLLFWTILNLSAQNKQGWELYKDHIDLPKIQITPKPTKVAGLDEAILNLNGTWRFLPKASQEVVFPIVPDTGSWVNMPVPCHPVTKGYGTGKSANPFSVWHYRTFEVPANWGNKRIKLRCNGIDGLAEIYINGKKVGQHDGPFVTFELDATENLKLDESNTILIKVTESQLSAMTQMQDLGGITRDIYFMAVPECNVSRFHITTKFDAQFKHATMQVEFTVRNQSDKDISQARVELHLKDGEKDVLIAPTVIKLPTIKAGESLSKVVEIPVSSPKKWDSEHPNLYNVTCDLVQNKIQVESLNKQIGFRQIEIRQNQMFVNNFPVKLHGVIHHLIHFESGWTIPIEALKKDILLYRDANINYVRIWPVPPEELVEFCDEQGMFISESCPVTFIRNKNINGLGIDYQNPYSFIESCVRYQLELIERDISHPSVLLWSTGNESDWLPNFDAQARAIKELDQSRPVTMEQCYKIGIGTGVLDMYTNHYDIIRFLPLDKPLFYTEWCHLEAYNKGALQANPGIRDIWGKNIKDHTEYMYNNQSCLGGCIFAGIDYRFTFPCYGHSYGEWGIMDAWRRLKPEYWYTKKAYSPIRIEEIDFSPGKPLKVHIKNRHNFTNLEEIKIEAIQGDLKAPLQVNIPAKSEGDLAIPSTISTNEPFILNFYSPKGYLIDTYKLSPKTDHALVADKSVWSSIPAIEKNGNNTEWKGEHTLWSIDNRTGKIQVRQKNTDQVLLQSVPELIVTPVGTRIDGGFEDIVQPPSFLTNWKLKNTEVKSNKDSLVIVIEGSYDEAKGQFTIVSKSETDFILSYDFEWLGYHGKKMKYADTTLAQEVGIAVMAPREMDKLTWQRKGLWSAYPDNHIGRLEGEAKLYRNEVFQKVEFNAPHTWDWYLDEEPEGTNDFRSMKMNYLSGSLLNKQNQGIGTISDGSQHLRALFNSNTNQMAFMVLQYVMEKPSFDDYGWKTYQLVYLKKGEKLKGTARFRLIP